MTDAPEPYIEEHQGWNIATIHTTVPLTGYFNLAYKGNVLRIRKANEQFLEPVEVVFKRKNEKQNCKLDIILKEDLRTKNDYRSPLGKFFGALAEWFD